MSEDKNLQVDESTLKEGAAHLEHVETKTGSAGMKSVLVCPNCNAQQDIPAEWEEMDEMPAPPNCGSCGTQMAVKIVAA